MSTERNIETLRKEYEIYKKLKGLSESQLDIVIRAMKALKEGKQIELVNNELIIL